METYDETKVGARIAWGRSHAIYRYGEDEIIKIPFLESWLSFLLRDGLGLQDRYTRDISLCQRYFGKYYLSTRIVTNGKGKIALVQPYIEGHYLSKGDLLDASVRTQFQELMRGHASLVAAGYEIDLIGQGGVLRRRLSNVLVLPDGSLKLFDATVVDMRMYDRSRYVIRLIGNLILMRQRSTLRYLCS
jgi:hypothetical protein